ncbi:MAG: ARPP-1 family domain-containing protein [Thermodesulfobacteriota bacterium]
MEKLVRDYLKDLAIGPGMTHMNLTVFPLIHWAEAAPVYLPLDAALEDGLLEITEVSQSGEVPNLKVTNHGKIPILILAGEEVVGAKQNRIVNATLLVAGHKTLQIPVSCVEAGRWHYRDKGFYSERRMSSPHLRTKVEQDVQCAIREGRGFRANQGNVWEEIEAKSARLAVTSPTAAMADIYDSYEEKLRQYTQHFPMIHNQKGILVKINGEIMGLEIFDSSASLGHYFDKLIQSYALDALDLLMEGQEPPNPWLAVMQWLQEVMQLPVVTSPSLGLGEDLRLNSQKVIGSGLMHETALVYLAVFPKPDKEINSGMARASRRGRFSK